MVQKADVATAIARSDVFDFCIDLIPRELVKTMRKVRCTCYLLLPLVLLRWRYVALACWLTSCFVGRDQDDAGTMKGYYGCPEAQLFMQQVQIAQAMEVVCAWRRLSLPVVVTEADLFACLFSCLLALFLCLFVGRCQ